MPRVETPSFGVSITKHPGHVVVVIAGELDLATGPSVSEAVGELRADGWDDIVADLRAVTFVDAAGLVTLLSADGAASRGGWRFRMAGPCPPLDRVLAARRIAAGGSGRLSFPARG